MIRSLWSGLRAGWASLRLWFGTEPPPPQYRRGHVDTSHLWSREPTNLVRALTPSQEPIAPVRDVEDLSWADAVTTVQRIIPEAAPVEHIGAHEDWSPTQELDSVALVGDLDPAARELHQALDAIEAEFHRGMRALVAFIQREWELSPTDELVLAGVQ